MVAVYVAGSSAELDRAESVMARLRSHGFEITHDWCADVRKNMALGKTDADLTDEEANSYARADLRAVDRSDVFLLLAPTTITRGAWVELGYAMRCLSTLRSEVDLVMVSGPASRSSIFTRCHKVFLTDDEAIAAIIEYAREAP